jgi:hypothetical protein
MVSPVTTNRRESQHPTNALGQRPGFMPHDPEIAHRLMSAIETYSRLSAVVVDLRVASDFLRGADHFIEEHPAPPDWVARSRGVFRETAEHMEAAIDLLVPVQQELMVQAVRSIAGAEPPRNSDTSSAAT